MAFTEFYCIPVSGTSSNLYAGSTTSPPVYTGVGDTDGVSIFTPSDGSFPINTVASGMFCSFYVSGTSTPFVSRITNVASGANGPITVSTTAKAGTIPVSGVSHNVSCVVGGPWFGPSGSVGFPFGFVTNTLTDVAGDYPRVNFNNNTTYSITAAMTHNQTGPIKFQGYTTSPGDGGQAVIDGGTSGTSFTLLTNSVSFCQYQNITFQNNGNSGNANGILFSGTGTYITQCIFSNFRGYGTSSTGSNNRFIECEFFGCNQIGNGSGAGATNGNGGIVYQRCYFHDNTGANSSGLFLSGSEIHVEYCIFDSNGQYGASSSVSSSDIHMIGCSFYNNGGDGLHSGNTNPIVFQMVNCDFIKNGGYGINFAGVGTKIGQIVNCAFGSGSQANTSGQINNIGSLEVIGSITYASGVTPWVSPSTGNFTIILPAAEFVGRGNFTQTGNGKSGTVGYPDIGAAQHQGIGSPVNSLTLNAVFVF